MKITLFTAHVVGVVCSTLCTLPHQALPTTLGGRFVVSTRQMRKWRPRKVRRGCPLTPSLLGSHLPLAALCHQQRSQAMAPGTW